MSIWNWFRRSKSLADELAEIFDSVVELKKLGRNEEDPENPFDYLRIVEICDAFKGALFERGIMIIATDLERSTEVSQEGTVRIVKTSFAIKRRQERLDLGEAFGEGKGEQALAVAQTMAYKAFLKRTSMNYGKADDPEAQQAPKLPSDPREAVRLASYQKRAWDAAVLQSGRSKESLSDELSALMKFPIDCEDIPNLPAKDFEVCMTWLIWQASVDQVKASKGPQKVVGILDAKKSDDIAECS